MIKNYFTIAWRNLMRNRVFSLINILGLTIGITVCMMIFLFIMNEFSYDNFHRQGKNIYRVMRGFDENGSKKQVAWLSPPYATALLNDYPNAIKRAVRVWPQNDLIVIGNKSFNEKKVYVTDADFFELFSFPLVRGNAATVLKEPGSVVITESTAKKYFGEVDPIGKTIQADKNLQLKVTGIARDVPANSTLDFDIIVPISNYFSSPGFDVWPQNRLYTYVLLNDHTSQQQVEATFPHFMDKYMGKSMAHSGFHFELSLTPLSDVYFGTSSDNIIHGDKKVVYIFLSIAVLILLIACINFTNLSTIRAVERSKEVGLRKVMGALRNHLVWQFIGESLLSTLVACTLSVGLLMLLMPWYNQLLGRALAVSWQTPPIYLFLAGVILVVGFLAGSYPAFYLSSFSPIEALKSKLRLGRGGSIFRQGLVVVQFSISVLLIIGTIIIMNQMNYIKNKDLGYNKEQTVIVPVDNWDIYKSMRAFKNDLQSKNNIMSVSIMSGEPGGFFDGNSFNVEGRNGQPWVSKTEFADLDYVRTLGVKIVAGRDFSSQYSTDSTDAVLINQTAAAELGFTDQQAIGKWIQGTGADSSRRRIVGVVQDFNFLSLKQKMDALVISPYEDRRVALIRLKPGNLQSDIPTIGDTYLKLAPSYSFEYSFLDQKFDILYKADIRQQAILSVFSGLAIFIAAMGLFGLASFTATKRIKEIGVRKVLGSSVSGIVLLLIKDLLKPIVLATIIAIPIGYYAMNEWLKSFAYRTTLNGWIFLLAAGITIAIALFTVSFKAVKAAMANPADSLKTE
jgi:putative ABC transport system permease protein